MTQSQDRERRVEFGPHSQTEDLLGSVSKLVNAVDKGLAVELAKYDMVPLEFLLLRSCREMGECTATQLAGLLPMDPSRVSRLVTQLVNLGYLRRRRLANDRRVVMLRLTPQGQAVTEQVGQDIGRYIEALMDGIGPEEMGSFLSTASRIAANCDEFIRSRNPQG